MGCESKARVDTPQLPRRGGTIENVARAALPWECVGIRLWSSTELFAAEVYYMPPPQDSIKDLKVHKLSREELVCNLLACLDRIETSTQGSSYILSDCQSFLRDQ